MEREVLENKIASIKKGSFVRIVYSSNAHTTKQGELQNITKTTTAIVRLGVNYSHLKVNANKITGKLKGREWDSDFTNYILYGANTTLLRVYTTKIKSKSIYTINGQITTKESLINDGMIKPQPQRAVPLCYDININNIISIG